ncbi:hypothetical protein [Micromonospora cathayae]|uniref:Uncharacterized protein n=1 Tax=Micromonospora cathayae TaxID=3028804 RepID=A0ABY7ZJP0_9ACTN|nr:hypothetical protein [Micromonospora sp. HUAS 3]WDZ83130.1 hypothetical protein PVK37_22035 [Micromonospora sp. HUAS 3]
MVFGVIVVALAGYLLVVGLDKADKLASGISAVVALIAMGAPYLLPPPSPPGVPAPGPNRVEDTVAAPTTGGVPADTGRQPAGDERPPQITPSGGATAHHHGVVTTVVMHDVTIEKHSHPPARGTVPPLVLLLVLCLCAVLLWRGSEAAPGLVGGPAAKPTVPRLYQADAPGAGCDNGGARWTLLKGKVTCTGQRAAYRDARVSLHWPGRAFPPAYEITLHADALGPTSCISMLMRDRYGVSACASGGVRIYRIEPEVTAIAGEPTGTFTQAQITIRVTERKLTLTVFTHDRDDVITLTVVDDAYGSGDVFAIAVTPPDGEPAGHATATLHGFQYRAIS